MKLTIKNFDALIGMECRGWRMSEVDELSMSYIFWFDNGREMKPITLSRNGNILPYKGRDRWTYMFNGFGRITPEWFENKDNAKMTFESMLD